ncbi:helix-turn-helix domain-containing protein [Streptosporangium sp. V21-05]|uniref:helix-turn-helix domain-containing protein n=1 Tax=Streptosporangium sp. V21-05 TaxID=3446115 RepID=UPI003F53ADFB
MADDLRRRGDDWPALARAVRARRRELGIPTQEDAGRRAGISPNTWQRVESGTPVSPSSLVAVAGLLGWDAGRPAAILSGASASRPRGDAACPHACATCRDTPKPGASEVRALRDRYASAVAWAYTTPYAIADAVLAVRDEEMAALRQQVEQARADERARISAMVRHYFAASDDPLFEDVRILCGRIERGEHAAPAVKGDQS